MAYSLTVPIREVEVDIIITRFISEPEVNFYDVEWQFADPMSHLLLLTEQEREYIVEYCWENEFDIKEVG